MEHLILAVEAIQQPAPTDLALMEVATEMLAVGSGLAVDKVIASFENYTVAQPSLEGLGDILKGIKKSLVNALKKMWYNFLKLFGSINADCKLRILKLKELRDKLKTKKDTDGSIDVEKLSQLVTAGRAKNFGDIAKNLASMYQTFSQTTDDYANFCSKYARMSFLGWQMKGKIKDRLIETSSGALKAVNEGVKTFNRKAPHDDSLNATSSSFGYYLSLNVDEIQSKAANVDRTDEKHYKRLADIARSISAKTTEETPSYQEASEIALPTARELTSVIDGLIVFYNDWMRIIKVKLKPFQDVVWNWINEIEGWDDLAYNQVSGKLVRKVAEMVVPDLGRLNKFAYTALNLSYPFYRFCDKNLSGLSGVHKDLTRIVNQLQKA